ncbi:MAG: sortase [Anaerolineales bacterium]
MKTTFAFRLFSALLLTALLLTGVGVRPAYAAGYTVNSLADNNTAGDGFCTLREAIESTNNAGNGDCGANSNANDIITFSVSGTITLGSTLPAIVSGAGMLTIDGGGNITISGNNSVQVMRVNSGANLTLQNLTIANGSATLGGGIYNVGTLTVTNATFSGNSADYGGGIENYGTLTVTDSTFSNNSATIYGGGIENYGALTVTDSTFSNNSANNNGGGILNYYSTLTVTNSTFSNNSATYDGGGVYNDGGTLTVTNSTFSTNRANNNGGGVFNYYGRLTVTNSTFSGNSATSGGGIENRGTLTLKNTLIANSTSGGDCVGSLSGSNINNLIEDSSNACGLTHGVNGNIIGFDPILGALTGSPAYFPLNPLSPAIDAGDDATCAAAPVNNQSQNGVTRPQDGDGNGTTICDIGSYERPDTTSPVLLSFTRFNPPGSPTTASALVFRAEFNGDVQNVDAADFVINATPATSATITGVTQVSPSLYEITVSGGDLGTFNGVIQLDIAPGHNITDLSGNPLAPPPVHETYLVQHLPSSAPPTVSGVVATGTGALLQGQTLVTGPTQFTVTFNQDVTAASAQNTANYLLVRAGGDGVQTQSCAGGVSGSDTAISIDSAVYAPATFTTTLNVNGGQPLPAGLYRLFVCGTTSIVNANGDELYAGLTDYGLVFSVTSSTSGGGSGGTSGGLLPATGFPMGRLTSLPLQPAEKAYTSTDLTLEIPALGVNAPIVGVRISNGSWDVSWLGTSVGWLEGSAFPTWQGNTVLTGHVWNADNTPGVFAGIKDLRYGNRFYIHTFNQTYVYEVRENTSLRGAGRVDQVFKHEELDWVTLLTCEGYNPLTGNYLFRRMVRAVLVEIR